jgi:hypothetical protein
MDREIPPPPPPICLEQRYPSSQKGGTLIAGGVVDLASHARRMLCPDSYRPAQCDNCGCCALHVHDRPWRVTRGEFGSAGVRILRFICSRCRATWRIVPEFLARHLWRTWTTVCRAVGLAGASTGRSAIPERTMRRWKSRLESAAGQLRQVLCGCAEASVSTAARGAGDLATRLQVVSAVGGGLAAVAALVHDLAAGVRVT